MRSSTTRVGSALQNCSSVGAPKRCILVTNATIKRRIPYHAALPVDADRSAPQLLAALPFCSAAPSVCDAPALLNAASDASQTGRRRGPFQAHSGPRSRRRDESLTNTSVHRRLKRLYASKGKSNRFPPWHEPIAAVAAAKAVPLQRIQVRNSVPPLHSRLFQATLSCATSCRLCARRSNTTTRLHMLHATQPFDLDNTHSSAIKLVGESALCCQKKQFACRPHTSRH
ncbi:hypothetical protein SVAN01_00094 [Stagonosporopsis vannaccii]|nr:hypothetical protein SVAN01_00094 [Stagonosporopsis vannaccii]